MPNESSPSSPTGDFRPLTLHRVALWLTAVAVAIIVVALVTLLGHQRTDGTVSQNFHHVFWFFDVGREYNVATWYGSGLWLVLGTLAGLIALSRPAFRASWWLFAAVSLVASIDEYLEMHEGLDGLGNQLLGLLPFQLGFSWVLLDAPIALVIALLLLRLVLSLPRRATIGIIVGGAIFVIGAIAVETVNGMTLARNDWVVTNGYIYGTMIEELLEMAGLSVALGSLVTLIQHDGAGRMRLDPALRAR